MKVVIISSLFPPDARGGAEIVAAAEAAELQKSGHTVVVVTTKRWSGWGSWRPEIKEQDGLKVYRFWPVNLFSFQTIDRWPIWLRLPWHALDMFNLFSYFTIRRILRQEQPDEVRTHNVEGIGYTVWAAVRAAGCRLIHTIHDVQLVVPSGLLWVGGERQLTSFPALLYLSVCRLLVGSPNEVISPSKWLLDFYRRQGFFPKAKLTVNLAFGKLPPAEQLLPLPAATPRRMLYVGQLATHKGIDWLLSILQSGVKYQWQLAIVGDGPLQASIQQLAEQDPRVVYHGRLTGAALTDLFAGVDVVVVPSLVYENAPTIIPLALQNHRPVVAAAAGGIPELLVEGVNGQLLPVGDEQAWRFALLSK